MQAKQPTNNVVICFHDKKAEQIWLQKFDIPTNTGTCNKVLYKTSQQTKYLLYSLIGLKLHNC